MLSKLLLFGYINLYCLALNHDSLNFPNKKKLQKHLYYKNAEKILSHKLFSIYNILG